MSNTDANTTITAIRHMRDTDMHCYHSYPMHAQQSCIHLSLLSYTCATLMQILLSLLSYTCATQMQTLLSQLSDTCATQTCAAINAIRHKHETALMQTPITAIRHLRDTDENTAVFLQHCFLGIWIPASTNQVRTYANCSDTMFVSAYQSNNKLSIFGIFCA